MPRSIWSGAISFGLVNVPVKLFTAVRKKDVRFHQLHAKDGARVQQRRVCSLDGEEVPYEELAKGYDLGGDRYVMIDPAELEELDPESTHTIDIEDFVDLDQIDPLFFDSPYYLVPDERGAKAYRLLLEAMRQANKVGIAKVVMRTKQYLVAIRPVGDALVMSTLNFADEVVPQQELDALPTQDVSERELKMAQQLIDALSTDFDPHKYRDTHRDQVLELIERKAQGEEIVAQPAAERPTPVLDLMAALEASLAAAKGEAPGPPGEAGAAPGAAAEASGEPAAGGEEKPAPARARKRKAS